MTWSRDSLEWQRRAIPNAWRSAVVEIGHKSVATRIFFSSNISYQPGPGLYDAFGTVAVDDAASADKLCGVIFAAFFAKSSVALRLSPLSRTLPSISRSNNTAPFGALN